MHTELSREVIVSSVGSLPIDGSVVPESRTTTCPSETILAAANAIRSPFLLRCSFSLFSPRRVFKRAFARWKSTSVGAVNMAFYMQEVFAHRDLGSVEVSRHVHDQDLPPGEVL
jgi:hypothetical protein